MKALHLLTAMAAVSLFAPVARAESGADQEIVVSANRFETPLSQVASSVTVIDNDELQRKREQSVIDALRAVPGLDVVRSGPQGGSTAVFLRGANPEHTLVLIDGVEANNPVSNARFYNLADLSLDGIERIEVLRGPQSTLYGSDAMGGVINIITKKGRGAPSGDVSAEAGSYGTYRERASIAGGEKSLNYSLGASRDDSGGVSAAAQRNGNIEHDGYANTSASARVGGNVTDWLEGNFYARYLDASADLDNGGGTGQDDPNRKLRNDEVFTRAEGKTYFWDDRVHQTFAVSYAHHDLHDDNDPDAMHPIDMLRSQYRGDLLKFEHQTDVKVFSFLTLTAGLETEKEQASSNYRSESAFGPFNDDFGPFSARTNGYYGQARVAPSDTLFSTFGVRFDDHSKFGGRTTWRVAPGYRIDSTGTKLNASFGTGFKAPSLFQLYSSYGRPDLAPEKNRGVDAGVEQALLCDDLHVGITYFWTKFDNLIDFDSQSLVFQNIAKARTSGFEATLRYALSKQLKAGVAYTYTDAEDRVEQRSLLRRPRNKLSADLWYQLSDAWSFDLNGIFVGKRFDNDFSTYPAVRTTLGSYVLVNLAASYRVDPQVELFVRVDNLFDREYEEVLGYGTPGVSAFGGVKVNFSA